MKRWAAAAALLLAAGTLRAAPTGAGEETKETADAKAAATPADVPGPTWIAEWTSRAGTAMQRVTLFSDGVLVRKSVADGKTEMKKRKLSREELASWVAVFRGPGADAAAGKFDSGMTGDLVARSVIRVSRADGQSWSLEFDSLSAVTPEAQRIRAAMEDLRDSFGKVTASSGDFSPAMLTPGRILKRRDGAEFRVVSWDERAGVVELKGVGEPYSQFYKLENLAASFYPP